MSKHGRAEATQEIWDKCDQLVAKGIYPSYAASELAGNHEHFQRVQKAWAESRRFKLRTSPDSRMAQRQSTTDQKIWEYLDRAHAAGLSLGKDRSGLSCGNSRWQQVRAHWAEARGVDISLMKWKSAGRAKCGSGRVTHPNPEPEPVQPKSRRAGRSEWQQIMHIMKRIEERRP